MVGVEDNAKPKSECFFLALSAGMLIALLSYDLVEEAFRIAGIGATLIGFMTGLLSYIGANQSL